MAIFTNFTPFSVAEYVGLDGEGTEFYVAVVKATFGWEPDGSTQLLEASQPVAEEDVYAGEKGASSVVLEMDLVPHKPRVDVVLLGELELPTAVDAVDVTLQVGKRVQKTLRVVGERVWAGGGMVAPVLSKPVRFTRMPIAWERSFGGTAPDKPEHVELRNPSGTGLVDSARAAEGLRAPNFEDPRNPIRSPKDRPAPVGFGPVGRHWQPRLSRAGTYDARWEEERAPLLPEDFDPRFYNCAPEDQQLESYLPGEEVRLTYLTRQGHDRFLLPDWRVPVTFIDAHDEQARRELRPDTIIIEPAARRFSLVGRVCEVPRPNVLALSRVLVGEPPVAWARAFEQGKVYLQRGTLRPEGE